MYSSKGWQDQKTIDMKTLSVRNESHEAATIFKNLEVFNNK